MGRRNLALIAVAAFAFALTACGGGGGGGSSIPATPLSTPTAAPTLAPTPTIAPTATPTAVPTTNPQSVLCTSQGAPQSVARQSAFDTQFVSRRGVQRAGGDAYAPGLIEAVYERSAFVGNRAAVTRVAADAGAREERAIDLRATGRVVEMLTVPAGQEDAAVAHLRSNPLVKEAGRAALRYAMSTTASSAFTNDPYFKGFAPANLPPFYTAAATPGQWDLHVICAANAWAYGQPNTTGVTHPGAQGGSAKIAIIDTGADMTHPELSGRVVYAESDLNGTQTVFAAPAFSGMTDTDGHGTNVAGIAAAAGNNNLGFTGVAYGAPLMIFKVFPDGPCAGAGGCTATSADVGQAITNAVANGAKVISLSLGAGTADPAEENAVAAAISAGVVVVAAAGNETHTRLDYPAADPGVIAVGASALNDATPGTIVETVASYSNYDALHASTWGIVAPGGDPSGTGDTDDLHWIENIYSAAASTSACTGDFGNSGGTPDCRVLIAGTSQATPHVAGAASLLLSVGATPGNIPSLLCSTATKLNSPKAGCGRLNVYKAMAQAVGDPSP